MARTWDDVGIDVASWESGDRKKECPQCQGTRSREHRNDRPLSVNVEKGVWLCHHCQWTGSLGLPQAGDWRDRLVAPKVYEPPAAMPEAPKLAKWAVDWLGERGISPETAAAFDLYTTRHYFPDLGQEAPCVAFPYYCMRDGERVHVNTKYRGPHKSFAMDKGSEKIFFALDKAEEATDLIVVEGELDVLALYEAGIREAVSVPNGGNEKRLECISSAADLLARVNTITLAVDMDKTGRELENELARTLGRERCKQTIWPEECKDANDVLIKHGAQALRASLGQARYYPVGGSVHFSDLKDELYKSYFYKPTRGYATGWPTMDKYYTIRPGELTVVTGLPGSGKSEWLASLLVNLVKEHSFSFSIFSAENYDDTPAPLAEQLIRKWIGKPFKKDYRDRMEWAEVEAAIEIFDGQFAFINPEEPTLDAILATAEVHLQRLGIKGLVLDPWNEISHDRKGLTETDYIGEALRRIRKFAREHEIHVWVVAHPTKMQRITIEDPATGQEIPAFEVPTPYSISGSANWYNKADNCLTVYRFKHNKEIPVQVHVQKIRKQPDVGTEGMVQFSYDWATSSYRDIPEKGESKGDSVIQTFDEGADFRNIAVLFQAEPEPRGEAA